VRIRVVNAPRVVVPRATARTGQGPPRARPHRSSGARAYLSPRRKPGHVPQQDRFVATQPDLWRLRAVSRHSRRAHFPRKGRLALDGFKSPRDAESGTVGRASPRKRCPSS
jgi:hypothetical protein